MKEVFLRKAYSMIIRNNNYNELEKEKIEYGLEGLYLTITKLIIILILATILNILKETIILMVFSNILRFFGFGIHAKTSGKCFIFSSVLFVIIPFFIYNMELKNIPRQIISLICIINLIIFAPSDSKERRFTDKKKYFIRKLITIIIALLYIYFSFNLENILSDTLLTCVLIQSIIVNPLTYKIMDIDYNYQFSGLNRNI